MIVKVVGVTYDNEDGSSRANIISRMSNTNKVCLERDPYNPYDSNAVKVLVLWRDEKKQIGYLPKDIAAKISPKLRRNVDFMVTVSRVGIWKNNPYCEIDIVEILSSSDVEDKVSSGSARPTFKPHRPSPTFTPPTRRSTTPVDEQKDSEVPSTTIHESNVKIEEQKNFEVPSANVQETTATIEKQKTEENKATSNSSAIENKADNQSYLQKFRNWINRIAKK